MLEETLEVCRLVYNSFLGWRKHDYETCGVAPDYSVQALALTRWKPHHPELCQIHSQVLQNVAKRVAATYEDFFRRVRTGENFGSPRFKGSRQYNSFTYPQSGFKVGQQSVHLFMFGGRCQIKARIHRPVDGEIRTCTIHRANHKWYACLHVEVDHKPLPPLATAVGVDVGLETFAALSDGEIIPNPRFFRKDEKALAKAARRLSRHVCNTTARRKARKVVSRIHDRIRNRRHDFAHQAARKLVQRFGIISVEELNIMGMVKNHCLAKSIADASWSMFRSVLTQKAESAGRQLIAVSPRYTSQTCSGCGSVKPKTLSQRRHHCGSCGLSLNRDVNAARNILTVGLHGVAGSPA